jgi:hypothetical protein
LASNILQLNSQLGASVMADDANAPYSKQIGSNLPKPRVEVNLLQCTNTRAVRRSRGNASLNAFCHKGYGRLPKLKLRHVKDARRPLNRNEVRA